MQKPVFFYIVGVLLILSSCSNFRKIQKSTDVTEKYEAAVKYYENQDYYRSNILFEEIMPFYRGKKENEQLQFYYAYVQYYQKQYILSAHYFKEFYDTYRRSELAEEALYMHAYSLYKQSPPYNLDQSSSMEAIDALQTFVNKYPDSKYMADAIDIMAELSGKLELKAFENAKSYYERGIYSSAIIAFDNFSKDYPDSDYNERAEFLKIQAAYNYAKKSILFKQKERYHECIDLYLEFLDDFPDSALVKQAESIYTDCLNQVDKLNKNNI